MEIKAWGKEEELMAWGLRKFLSVFVFVGFFFAAQFALAGQKGEDCPYCHNAPEVLQKAGLVNHGPFDYAGTTSTEVEKHLGYVKDFYWLESAHFKYAISLPSYNVPEKDKKRYLAELTELQASLPAVNPRTQVLDPWLRIHLFIHRSEKFYKKFLETVNMTEDQFPKERVMGAKYVGEGPYLGEKGKYQVFLISAKAPYLDFLKTYTGVEHDRPQRWNFLKTDSLWFGCQTVDDQLNQDLNLYATVIHNLAHNFLDGFKHYSYDLPVWLTEGFAHHYERQAYEGHTSYCFVETFKDYKRDGANWVEEVRRRLGTMNVPSVAELSRRRSYSDLSLFDHMVVWSLIDFMAKTDKKKFAAFLDQMKGRLNAEGFPDSKNLTDAQREAIKSIYGWSYTDLESNWRAFVAKEYGK